MSPATVVCICALIALGAAGYTDVMAYSSEQRQFQRAVARIIGREAPRNKARKWIKTAYVAAWPESGHRNIPLGQGDADSEGPFQIRRGIHGPHPKITQSVKWFLKNLKSTDRGQGSAQLAADIERPAAQYAYKYGTRDTQRRAGQLTRKYYDGHGSGGSGGPSRRGPKPDVQQSSTRTDTSGALVGALLAHRKKGGSLLASAGSLIDTGAYDREVKAPTPSGPLAAGARPSPSSRGSVRINRSSADRPGARTKQSVIRFARKVSSIYGSPVTIGTGTQHSRTTTSGGVSEHWTGNAVDIPATGKKLTRLGQAALIAAGMPRGRARKITGGLHNVGRHQIIFNTNTGGNHYNHLHISAR